MTAEIKYDFMTHLKEKKDAFESVLYSQFKGVTPPPSESSWATERIYEAMHYSLEAGGKRLRPLLFLEAYQQCGRGVDQGAINFALALEMIHTYSLIHDDLPAMDDDDFRRGKPTNHKVFGEGLAVLAGDGLLNSAFEKLLEGCSLAQNKTAALAAASHIARAAGVHGMIGGQVADMLSEGKGLAGDQAKEALAYIHAHKTGALLVTSVYAAACLADSPPQTLEALKAYGENVGMAFQIVDDILDIVGDQAVLGKDIGSDAARGKLTYPALYGLDQSREMAKGHLDAARAALGHFEAPSPFLMGLVDFLEHRQF